MATAVLSVQLGAGFVVGLFPRVGSVGVVTLRLVGSALVLLLVLPWRRLRRTGAASRSGREPPAPDGPAPRSSGTAPAARPGYDPGGWCAPPTPAHTRG